MRLVRIAVLVALIATACGGGGGGGGGDTTTTTSTAETTTTTQGSQATTTTAADTQVVDIRDIPQECIDAFAGFLREIEPYVADIDWDNASTADLEQLGNDLEPLSSAYDDSVAGTNCDNIELDATDEESFQFMIDMARDEAPGTVPYLEWVAQIAVSTTDPGTAASGDCETDIAAFQAIVDGGGTMMDLPLSDLGTVTGLITSISTTCSATRAAEFFNQSDVAAFMNGGG